MVAISSVSQLVPSELFSSGIVGILMAEVLLQCLQPCRQFGIGLHIQAPGGGDRVEALGNEQVDVVEMLLERRQRRGVPAHIKGRAQWIIGGRHLA